MVDDADDIIVDNIGDDSRVLERHRSQSWRNVAARPAATQCIADVLTSIFDAQDEFQCNVRISTSLNNMPENIGQIIFGVFAIFNLKPPNHRRGSNTARRIP